MITAVPGSSDYYLGGILAYHNRVKESALQVPPAVLTKYGAVSAETAKLMASNVRQLLGSDIGIGITGIAGPGGGSKKKPVGLVYFAISDKKKISVRELRLRGSRAEIRSRAANEVLNSLRLSLA